ncbi:MAG TPA: hypothetical protein VD864_01050, partial [Nocardioides sp.]|nr:hypothetical protein [Nocardioides sp.]
NFRTTERGMARQRIQQANRGERLAQYEASLWQARAADLEYHLRQHGKPVPPISAELTRFIDKVFEDHERPEPPVNWDPQGDAGGRPGL